MSLSQDFTTIASLGTIVDLRVLVPHLAPRSATRDAEAVRAAAAILERATPDDVAWLERNRVGDHEYGAWSALQAADLGTPPLVPESASAPIVALGSMHRSGYVREAAVRLLATRTDGAELPYLLLRLNDWVPEVRAFAERAVRDRLVAAYSKHFVACLGITEALRAGRRVTHKDLLGEIDRLLSEEAAWEAVFEGLHSKSPAVRRASARIAVRRGDAVLVLRAATSRDPVVAAIGAKAVGATWTPEALREVVPQMRRASPGVRWRALGAVCDRLPGEAESFLRESLLDSSVSVRELARYRWERVGLPALDFAAFYRDALSGGGVAELRGRVARAGGRKVTVGAALAVAVRGLAETGSERDGALFEGFLHHSNGAVRAAAISGLGRCGGPAWHAALEAAMDDACTRVAAEARRWVRLRLGRAAVRYRPR